MQISTIARILLLLPLLMLGACVSNDMSDLRQYVDEVLARKGGRIEPIPEIQPYEAYSYKSADKGMRNPFELFYGTREEVAQDEDAGLTEEMERELRERNREELEQFELDSLRMVGTLEDKSTQWGIVLDPDGVVHRVKVGNYLGRNVGKILNIYEDRIELREIIRNSQGVWEERQAAIALAEE